VSSIIGKPSKNANLNAKPGPKLQTLKQNARRRVSERISKENLVILKRLQSVRPEYSAEKFRKQRKNHHQVLKLRRTDYTAGHIMSQTLQPVRTQKQRSLMASSFASITSEMNGDEKEQAEPMIYVDPEALKHLPKATPSRQASRSRPRRRSPNNKIRRSPSPNNDKDGDNNSVGRFSPTNIGNTRRSRRSLSPTSDDDRSQGSASTSKTAVTHSNVTIFTGKKDFIVFGQEKESTSDCIVEILMKDPWTNEFTLNIANEKVGNLATKYISLKEAKKIESWYEHSNKGSADDIADLQEILSSLFMEADKSGTGQLKYDEFIAAMESADLGITGPELRMVMAEADDNDDGVIDYEEFVPIAIDLIQAFKSRAHARRKQDEQDAKIDEDAIKQLYTDDLKQTEQTIRSMLLEIDVAGRGTVSRQEYKNVLMDNRTGLTKVEAKMIEMETPRDNFGRILYAHTNETLMKVRLQAIKNAILETQATDIEKYILELCKDKEFSDANANKKESLSLDKTRSEDGNSEKENFAYGGKLADRKVATLLQGAKKLSLNKLQVLALMCEAEVEEGMVNYWKFVPVAAKAIEAMFEPSAMAQRASLMDDSSLEDATLMQGRERAEVEEMIRTRFREFDKDGGHSLDPTEFSKCLIALDLGLTKNQINALLVAADSDGDGEIDEEEFVALAYDQLLYLEKEKHLRELSDAIVGEKANIDSRVHRETNRRSLGGYALTDEEAQDEEAVQQMEQMLMKLFTTADVNSTGHLTAVEFKEIIQGLNIGIDSFQQSILMAEADENEDAKIQYDEFVPICAELLQTYKAKAELKQAHDAEEAELLLKTSRYIASQRAEITKKMASVMDSFRAADKKGTKRLRRNVIQQCLMGNKLLEKGERNLILHGMIMESDGMTNYMVSGNVGIEEIMQNSFEMHVRKKFQLQQKHSSLYQHLLQLFEDEERLYRMEERFDDKSISSLSSAGLTQMDSPNPKGGAIRFIDDGAGSANDQLETGMSEERSANSFVAGYLPQDRIYGILRNAKHLKLSRVQLLAVMSLTDDLPKGISENDDGAIFGENDVSYRDFANSAAEMITKFYDPREIRRKSMLEKRTDNNALKLMGGVTEDDMKKRLIEELKKSDPKNRRNVSEGVFKEIVLRCFAQCSLSEGEMSRVIGTAEKNEAGRVLYDTFLTTSYIFALAIKKERADREQEKTERKRSMSNARDEDDDMELCVPPTKVALEALCNALFAQISLESRGGELVIHFSEETSAVSSETIKKVSRERHISRIGARGSISLGGGGRIGSGSMMIHDFASGGAGDKGVGLGKFPAPVEEVVDLVLHTERVRSKVVNEKGEALDVTNKVIVALTKNVVQQFLEFECEVRVLDEKDTEKRKASGEGGEPEILISGEVSGMTIEGKYVKLPSLALCDDDAAKTFAINLIGCVHIVKEGGTGKLSIGLRNL